MPVQLSVLQEMLENDGAEEKGTIQHLPGEGERER